MTISKADAIKIINKSKSIDVISFADHMISQAQATKIVADAIRSKSTILLIK